MMKSEVRVIENISWGWGLPYVPKQGSLPPGVASLPRLQGSRFHSTCWRPSGANFAFWQHLLAQHGLYLVRMDHRDAVFARRKAGRLREPGFLCHGS